MAGHTKGPWVYTEDEFNRDECKGDAAGSIVTAFGWYVATIEHLGNHTEVNARLIAAAPDLLAALTNVQKIIAEAAMTGFNWKDGDWPERLFLSQQTTSAAIRRALAPAQAEQA